jgi:hypothetical protein
MAVEHGYMPLGKYSSARDDILHWLCMNDWANGSFGDVEAPTGYVYRISNFEHDVAQPNNEFNSLIDGWFEENQEVTDSPELRAQLVGFFLVLEDSNGFVHVRTYDTEALALEAFHAYRDVFEAWDNQDDED